MLTILIYKPSPRTSPFPTNPGFQGAEGLNFLHFRATLCAATRFFLTRDSVSGSLSASDKSIEEGKINGNA